MGGETKSLGKNVPLDEVERLVVAQAIMFAVNKGGVSGFESFEALKSARAKIAFSPEELDQVRARVQERQKTQAPQLAAVPPAASKASKALPKKAASGK